ncbi:MAG: hypothetical protein AABZ80_05560 [Gemmatimonadota bacterium]
MALTLPRWIAAVVAGCLIAMTVIFRTPEAKPSRADDARMILVKRANRLESRARLVRQLWRQMVLRDSVRASIRRMPASDTARFLSSGGANASNTARLLSVTTRPTRTLAAQSAFDVAFITETDRSWYSSWTLHALPESPTERCLVIRHASGFAGRDVARDLRIRRLQGACGFYAAFGAPGAKVDTWLRSHAWMYGLQAPRQRRSMLDTANLYWWNRGVPFSRSAGYPLREYLSTVGYRCVAGIAEDCRRIMMSDSLTLNYSSVWFSVSKEGIRTREYWSNDMYRLGPNSAELLSDMAFELGRERFQRFWSSPLPVEEAFKAASGEDLGEWTYRWARKTYGNFGLGPGLPASAAVVSLVLAALFVGAAMVAAGRRQIL